MTYVREIKAPARPVNAVHAEHTETLVAIAVRRILAIADDADNSERARLGRALADIDASCTAIELIHDGIQARRAK
jgi:hypothetical protein